MAWLNSTGWLCWVPPTPWVGRLEPPPPPPPTAGLAAAAVGGDVVAAGAGRRAAVRQDVVRAITAPAGRRGVPSRERSRNGNQLLTAPIHITF